MWEALPRGDHCRPPLHFFATRKVFGASRRSSGPSGRPKKAFFGHRRHPEGQKPFFSVLAGIRMTEKPFFCQPPESGRPKNRFFSHRRNPDEQKNGFLPIAGIRKGVGTCFGPSGRLGSTSGRVPA